MSQGSTETDTDTVTVTVTDTVTDTAGSQLLSNTFDIFILFSICGGGLGKQDSNYSPQRTACMFIELVTL